MIIGYLGKEALTFSIIRLSILDLHNAQRLFSVFDIGLLPEVK